MDRKRRWAMKAAGVSAAAWALGGCASGVGQLSPRTKEMMARGEKPKVYVHSTTMKRLEGAKEWDAIWMGIDTLVFHYNQVMRCDVTPETAVALKRAGFEVVNTPDGADYDVAVEVLACASCVRPDDPQSEDYSSLSCMYMQAVKPWDRKPLLLDLKDFLTEVKFKKPEVRDYYSRMMDLLERNDEEGRKMYWQSDLSNPKNYHFYSKRGWWKGVVRTSAAYLNGGKSLLFPHKYDDISDEEKAFISRWSEGAVGDGVLESIAGPLGFVNVGSTLSSLGHGTAGGVAAGLGALLLFSKPLSPEAAYRTTVTNLRTGQSRSADDTFFMAPTHDFDDGVDRIADSIADHGLMAV